MKVSIIVPVKEINDYVIEVSRHVARLDFDSFELIVFPDRDTGVKLEGVRIIATGPVGPAEKRDLAIEHAKGEILAFLDDDAYPRTDWLRKALIHFSDGSVGAVGGPAVTPEDDSVSQKASGAVFSSMLTSAGYTYRYVPGAFREVDDFPTVNLLVRKSVFERLGGFDTSCWPGEDTKLCLDITKKLGLKIVYEPDAVVYHHRRPLFGRAGHFSQVARYAFQRGYFVKAFPETSLRPGYFVPSLFLLYLISGPLFYMFSQTLFYLWISVMAVYAGALTLASVFAAKANSIAVGALVWPGIFLTHLTYGLFFLKGISARKRGLRIAAVGEVF